MAWGGTVVVVSRVRRQWLSRTVMFACCLINKTKISSLQCRRNHLAVAGSFAFAAFQVFVVLMSWWLRGRFRFCLARLEPPSALQMSTALAAKCEIFSKDEFVFCCRTLINQIWFHFAKASIFSADERILTPTSALTLPSMVITVMSLRLVIVRSQSEKSNSFMLPKRKAANQLGMQDRKVPWNEIYWAWSWNLCPMRAERSSEFRRNKKFRSFSLSHCLCLFFC